MLTSLDCCLCVHFLYLSFRLIYARAIRSRSIKNGRGLGEERAWSRWSDTVQIQGLHLQIRQLGIDVNWNLKISNEKHKQTRYLFRLSPVSATVTSTIRPAATTLEAFVVDVRLHCIFSAAPWNVDISGNSFSGIRTEPPGVCV